MPTLHLQLLTGPGSGRTASFADAPVAFGRDHNNALILDESFVSRKHGEFLLDGDRWILLNHSPNGTLVNRRSITGKSHPLAQGDVIAIGDVPIFRVGIESAPPGAPAASGASGTDAHRPAAELSAEATAARKRRKTFIILGVWWAIVLLVVVFLLTLKDKSSTSSSSLTLLTREQMAREVAQPLPYRVRDEAAARGHMEQAEQAFGAAAANDNRLYLALSNYKQALAYLNTDYFSDPFMQFHYQSTKEKLTDLLWDRYNTAIALRSKPRDAQAAFDRVTQLYPDYDSQIYRNADALKLDAIQRLKQQK